MNVDALKQQFEALSKKVESCAKFEIAPPRCEHGTWPNCATEILRVGCFKHGGTINTTPCGTGEKLGTTVSSTEPGCSTMTVCKSEPELGAIRAHCYQHFDESVASDTPCRASDEVPKGTAVLSKDDAKTYRCKTLTTCGKKP